MLWAHFQSPFGLERHEIRILSTNFPPFISGVFPIAPDPQEYQTVDLAGKRGTGLMAQENVRLRLEAADGSGTKEYRIDSGRVEVRIWQSHREYDLPENSWHEVNAEELSAHVERNTVVARWLELRLGWRRLLQACVSEGARESTRAETYRSREDFGETRAA